MDTTASYDFDVIVDNKGFQTIKNVSPLMTLNDFLENVCRQIGIPYTSNAIIKHGQPLREISITNGLDTLFIETGITFGAGELIYITFQDDVPLQLEINSNKNSTNKPERVVYPTHLPRTNISATTNKDKSIELITLDDSFETLNNGSFQRNTNSGGGIKNTTSGHSTFINNIPKPFSRPNNIMTFGDLNKNKTSSSSTATSTSTNSNGNNNTPSSNSLLAPYLKSPLNQNMSSNRNISLIDPSWELIDPNPDIYALFSQFNKEYFWSKLGSVSVSWNKKLTSCAGTARSITSGQTVVSVDIHLSELLLQLRPRKDLVETLLHEMIHAYVFLMEKESRKEMTINRGHGPTFKKHMDRLNKLTGANITVYHDWHEEVNYLKQHWWHCDGPCRSRPPYYGLVKRSMNRAPGPNDLWHSAHAASCGGTFIKIREPEKKPAKKTKTPTKTRAKKPASASKAPTSGGGGQSSNGYFSIFNTSK